MKQYKLKLMQKQHTITWHPLQCCTKLAICCYTSWHYLQRMDVTRYTGVYRFSATKRETTLDLSVDQVLSIVVVFTARLPGKEIFVYSGVF